MRRAATVLATTGLSLLIAGCVPAIEDPDPAGAAGFVTEPSAATRGEPFITDDGWTLRIEALVLSGSATASPVDDSDREMSSYDTDYVRWNARQRVELYARGLLVGRWRLDVSLYPYYSDDGIIDVDVDPALARRLPAIESGGSDPIDLSAIPLAVLIVRAEKDGRVVDLDTTLALGDATVDQGSVLDVKANALVVAPLLVEAERLFQTSRQRLEFEPIAAADADADGTITRDELQATPAPIEEAPLDSQVRGGDDSAPLGIVPRTLADLLNARLMTVLRTPAE